jgi:hypothetical protein
VWLVRDGSVQFALPFTTGTKPGVADYLPAPHGLPGFAVPVEQVVPALVPFIELKNGQTIVAADGADSIQPSGDGRGVKAVWTRWAVVGARPTELVDPGLTSEVEWSMDGTTMTRSERLVASRPVHVRRWRVIVPVTGDRWETMMAAGVRHDTFSGAEGRLTVSVPRSDWAHSVSGLATGDAPDGRGARGAIPLHLIYEAENIELQPAAPRGWSLRLHLH